MERLTFRKVFKDYNQSKKTTVICVDGYMEMVDSDSGSLSPFDEKWHYYLAG